MGEKVLISKPAMIIETKEISALVDRIERQDGRLSKLETSQSRLEHAMFGFQREEDNSWVDGVLQNVADMRRLQAQLVALLVRVGVPVGLIMAMTSFAVMLKSYGVDQAIGAFVKGLLGIPI